MAGRIPQQFIDDVLARVDIVDVIDARVPLRKAGREFTACCPFHSEKSPSFSVSPQKQFYHCFGCGAHGNALSFLMEFEHAGFIEAIEELASMAGLEVPREADDDAPRAREAAQGLYEILEQATKHYQQQLRRHPQAGRAVDYLKGRGLSGEIAREFELGYAPPGWDGLLSSLGKETALRERLFETGMLIKKDEGGYYDRFRDRVMFPIRDGRGRVIGFGGRVLGNDTPKYLNSPETPVFHKGRELYGYYQARKSVRDLKRIVVVEGYMDVLALAQHDIRYCVATLGTATTQDHLERLFRAVDEVVFCFDGDRAGRAAAQRALENALPVMREGRQIRFMFLPEGEDPDTLVRKEGREAFEDRIGKAVTFSEFFYESLVKQVDISTMDGRAQLVELARPLLSRIAPGVLRHMMVMRLAQIAGIDADKVEYWLNGERKPVESKPPQRKEGRHPRQSLVRKALELLFHRPALATLAQNIERVRSLRHPGAALLCEVLELLQERPHLTVGGLLEHWRGREDWQHLSRLAQASLDIPQEALEDEFRGVVRRLDELFDEQRIEDLCDQERRGSLSEAEKGELNELLRKIKGAGGRSR